MLSNYINLTPHQSTMFSNLIFVYFLKLEIRFHIKIMSISPSDSLCVANEKQKNKIEFENSPKAVG